MKNYICFIILNLSTCLSCMACMINGNYSITEKWLMSETVVEGTLIDKQCVWVEQGTRIITIYTIATDKNYSTNSAKNIQFYTNGGIIGDEWHVSSADLTLEIGERGIFFISKEKENKISDFQQLKLPYAHFGKSTFLSTAPQQYETDAYKKLIDEIQIKLPNPKYIKINEKTPINYKSPSISSVSIDCLIPDVIVAGNADTLTIEGSGFGEYIEGSSMVVFSSADSGGGFVSVPYNFLTTWTDTLLKVVVPQRAGTGVIKVYTADNGSASSNEQITVPYALKTSSGDQTNTYLINKNGFGGYTLSLHENFIGIADESFIRAVKVLQNEVGFNLTIGDTATTVSEPGNDGVDVVGFDSDIFPISAAGVAYSQYRRCGKGWETAGLDLFFNSPDYNIYNWNFTEEEPEFNQLDFQTVAMHELLHAFQIAHCLDETSIMTPLYTIGSSNRVMSGCNDLMGCHQINLRSLFYVPTCSGHTNYYPHNYFYTIALFGLDCQEGKPSCFTPSLDIKVFLEGFYDGENTMSSEYYEKNLLPNIAPFNTEPWFYFGAEELSDFEGDPSLIVDWILIELFEEEAPLTPVKRMAGFVLTDGSVVSAEGYTLTDFIDLEDINYLVNISHTSHLTVQTQEAISLNTTETLDFTTTKTTTLGEVIEEVETGVFALYSGDFDGNGIINNLDYNLWNQNSALVQTYSPIDTDGNTLVNNIDYNFWAKNRSRLSPALNN